MSEKRNVPKLRFPSFDKEWSESTLGDQTSWKSGGTPPKEVGEYWNGDIPWISASSMRGTKFFTSELMVTESGSKNGTRIAPKGSLLLLVRGSMLFNKIPVGIAERDVTFNQDVKAITPDGSTTSDFLLQWFLKSERNILGIVGGTGIGAGKLDTKELQSLTYSFPSLPEQQKIAEFMTAVDRRIELLQAKKEKLEAYKKGVMQRIFSQQLRFKADDGSEFPNWEIRKLSDVVSNKAEKFDPKKANKEIRCIELEHISPETGRLLGFVDGSNQESIKNRFKKGDVLFGKLRPYLKKYLFAPFDGVCTSEIWVLRGSPGLDNTFLYFLVQTSKFLESTNQSTGSKMPRADWATVASVFYQIPTQPEQVKIVQFLTSLDRSIENLNQQLTHTQTWKKGLLQKMFV